MSTQDKNYSLGRAARTTTTLGMAGLVMLGGAAIGAPAMAADAAPAGDVSAAVASSQQGKRQVTLKAPSSATKGAKVKLQGKVKKDRHHKTRVVIQQKHGKKWQKVDVTKTNKKGKFNTSDVLKGKNKVTLRAKAKGHGMSATQTVKLTKATNGNGTPATPATPAQPAQPVTPQPAPVDPMSITVAPGNAQALQTAIQQAPNGATLHLSGQYKLTTDMPGPTGTGYAAGVVIDRALTLDGGKLISDGSDNVVDVTESGDLTLTGGIWVTGGQAEQGAGIYNAGRVVADNAYIWGNTAEDEGGGVYNTGEHATFTLNGGEVGSQNKGDGNTADHRGGGIYNDGGTVNLKGGSIIQNDVNGGGNGGGGIYNDGGTVNLNGGSITDNYSYNGGGIYITDGTVNLNGGSITGNRAMDGGGIYIKGGTLNDVDGKPVTSGDVPAVSGNTASLRNPNIRFWLA